MDLTNKHPTLIDEFFVPDKNESLRDKYVSLKRLYDNGAKFILMNNTSVFGPFPKPEKAWDISELEKYAIYNPEVTKVLSWIKTRIVINLGCIEYKTLDVLIRIATGMLNKCNIPKEIQMTFHDNMVKNLVEEYNNCVLSTLPF